MITNLFNTCICHRSLISDSIYAFVAHTLLQSAKEFIYCFTAIRLYSPDTKLSFHIMHGGFFGNKYTLMS
jgi:hypothetical protein